MRSYAQLSLQLIYGYFYGIWVFDQLQKICKAKAGTSKYDVHGWLRVLQQVHAKPHNNYETFDLWTQQMLSRFTIILENCSWGLHFERKSWFNNVFGFFIVQRA